MKYTPTIRVKPTGPNNCCNELPMGKEKNKEAK